MSSWGSESGQTTPLVLVGLMLLVIPAGLAVAQGLSTTAPEQSTIPTVTPPSLITPTPTSTATETPTPTATPTPTSTPTPDGNDNDTNRNGTAGQTHFVNADLELADGVTSDDGCSGANYTAIQAAVDDAGSGETVVVCPGTYSEHVEVTTANLTITAADRLTQGSGDVTITNANESAVWINAPGVTLQGFNISVDEGAQYAIEVGGQEAVIRDNTVDSPGVGIFLSDGRTDTGECRIDDRLTGADACDGGPPVDSELGAATQGRVLNNTVKADILRIWVDADQTLVQNNFVTDREISENPENYAECTRDEPQRPCNGRFNDSIVSSGNDTIIRGNTIQIDKQPTGIFHWQAGIMIGKTPTQGHNMATNNTVVDNSYTGSGANGIGIKTRNITAGANIWNNNIKQSGIAIRVYDEATIRNNYIPGCGGTGIWVMSLQNSEARNYDGKEVFVVNNTVERGNSICSVGVWTTWDTVIKGNRIRDFTRFGVRYEICGGGAGRLVDNKIISNNDAGREGIGVTVRADTTPTCVARGEGKQIEIQNNQITNNKVGIEIRNNSVINPSLYEIHNNTINNNEDIGIYNQNKSVIVDATNNIWACGGPSGGANPLSDPYTGKLANGSGDLISAGNGSTRNGHPISNVHFDPFRELSSCPNQTSTPSRTATPTSTPTPPPDGGGNRYDGGGGDNGSGDGGGTGSRDGTGNGEGGGGDRSAPSGSNDGGNTGTPPSTSTATPTSTQPPTATPIPPDTPTPTPVVEPGFGIATWLVGVLLAVSLLARRPRGNK